MSASNEVRPEFGVFDHPSPVTGLGIRRRRWTISVIHWCDGDISVMSESLRLLIFQGTCSNSGTQKTVNRSRFPTTLHLGLRRRF
jgi:hypothetical protein